MRADATSTHSRVLSGIHERLPRSERRADHEPEPPMTDPTSDPTPSPEPRELHRLLEIVRRLRAPDGCPWDREQTLQSMAPCLIEEAFEAADAIRKDDTETIREELGDVLMNVLMLAQIAGESGRFDREDVARGIADKLVRRHPHVFGEGAAKSDDAAAVLRNWEAIKQRERAEARGADAPPPSVLDGVPDAMPALHRAQRVGEKAARVGFDWPDLDGPRRKLHEELEELDRALADGDPDAIHHELGDVLFSVVNVSRKLGVHAEDALHAATDRFRRRFGAIERELGDGLRGAGLERLEAAWQQAKRTEQATVRRLHDDPPTG
jgi:ATP diphosphatase